MEYAWVLLLPQWKLTTIIIRSRIIPALIGVLYVVYMLIAQFRSVGTPTCIGCAGDGMSSLSGLLGSFTNLYILQAAWIHYLAFDFFVGSFIVEDARECGIPHLFVVPCALLTLFLGPVGILVYVILRFVLTRSLPAWRVSEPRHKARWFFSRDIKLELILIFELWLGTKDWWIDAANVFNWMKRDPDLKPTSLNVEQEQVDIDRTVYEVES